jgi:rubrerythrin|uniref:DNA-directed RNA polymerase n=1 Tax=virus sp. ctyMK1 TaxID=2828002 RepID=A0A8S5REE0_9VIRU|nr:MAG TPA: DNA-directed RNA polymerase [virus sp. ctyMK1]
MRLIDADIFKKSIEKDCENINKDFTSIYRGFVKEVMKGFLKDIDEQPTVKPTHGKWIDEGGYLTTAYGSLHSYTCSECGADVIIESYDNFCPNCGAKMEDEQE